MKRKDGNVIKDSLILWFFSYSYDQREKEKIEERKLIQKGKKLNGLSLSV